MELGSLLSPKPKEDGCSISFSIENPRALEDHGMHKMRKINKKSQENKAFLTQALPVV